MTLAQMVDLANMADQYGITTDSDGQLTIQWFDAVTEQYHLTHIDGLLVLELLGEVRKLADDVTDWAMVADGVKHDWRCRHHFNGDDDCPVCLRCQVEKLTGLLHQHGHRILCPAYNGTGPCDRAICGLQFEIDGEQA